jgi:predicted RNase H-like HicB family nuclease
MTYYAIVENSNQGIYTAKVMGWPECVAQGVTREEALEHLRQVFAARLTQGQVVPQEIETPQSVHPWLKFAGMFKNDPLFDGVIAAMEAYRRELDAASDPV